MNTSILFLRQIVNRVFATALACLPGLLLGAEKKLETPAAVPLATPTGYQAQELQILDGQIDRPQGKVEATLPNVVDALRDQYQDANIVLSPSLAKVKVGDLKLRAGRLIDELEAVRIASGEKFEVQAPNGPIPQQIDPNTGLPVGSVRSSNAGLFVLRAARPIGQNRRVVEAFNISPYVEWLRHQPKQAVGGGVEQAPGPDEIELMILSTLRDFQGDAAETDQPSFRYHRGTGLLIVIGTVDSVEVARKIVNVLPGMSSVSQESRAAFGLEPGQYVSPADRAARQRAEDAFRARYGLMPRSAAPAQPEPGPDAGSSK